MRDRLGYGRETLIIFAVGGTSVGKELLELCASAFPLVREQVPDLRMVLVSGPRLSSRTLKIPEGVETRKYVPNLYGHFAAADLSIVQGGGTSTLELTALRRPFIFFPREGGCEQTLHVAKRLRRHGAGTEMGCSSTTPASLAATIISLLGEEPHTRPVPVRGDKVAAEAIGRLLCADS